PTTRSPRSTDSWTPTRPRARACWCCRPSPAWKATTPGRSWRGRGGGAAGVVGLSACAGLEGCDARPELDDEGWRVLLGNLDRLAELAAGRGVRAVLHPHVGTMVENGTEVQRVLQGSSVDLCLDTGHLLIGGTDPAGPA